MLHANCECVHQCACSLFFCMGATQKYIYIYIYICIYIILNVYLYIYIYIVHIITYADFVVRRNIYIIYIYMYTHLMYVFIIY